MIATYFSTKSDTYQLVLIPEDGRGTKRGWRWGMFVETPLSLREWENLCSFTFNQPVHDVQEHRTVDEACEYLCDRLSDEQRTALLQSF